MVLPSHPSKTMIFFSTNRNNRNSNSNTHISRILIFLFLIIGIASAEGFSPATKTNHLAQRNLRSSLISSASAAVSNNESIKMQKPTPKYSWTKPTLELALPALVASIADPLISMMDTAYIGRLGKEPLAALGVCTSIFYISFYGFLATKTATTTLVASASSNEEAKLVTSTSIQLGVAAGLSVLLFLSFRGPQCLGAMGIEATSDIFPHALTYLSTRCLSAPFFLLITVSEGALRGFGDTRIPLLASIATSATMAALEPLLMFALGWHIRGSAAAMGLSQVSGALVYSYFLRKRFSSSSGVKSKDADKDSLDQSMLTKSKIFATIVKANASMILKQGSLLFTWAYATKSAAKFGAAHVAAHQVALSFWMVFAYILDAVSVGAQILLSKARTRKSLDEVRSVTKYMASVATIQGLIITSIIAGLTPYVPSFFTSDEAVISQLKTLMPVLSMQQVLISLTFVFEVS
jgi:MATE family multidrug resistance protein